MTKKSFMALMLSLVLVVGLLAACAGNNNGQNNGETNAGSNQGTPNNLGEQEAAPEAEELEGSLITKDPLELSIHMHYANRFAFDENWSIFKKAAELTNVTLKGTAPATGTDSNEMSI